MVFHTFRDRRSAVRLRFGVSSRFLASIGSLARRFPLEYAVIQRMKPPTRCGHRRSAVGSPTAQCGRGSLRTSFVSAADFRASSGPKSRGVASPRKPWEFGPVSAPIRPVRPDRPSSRVFGALLRVPKNGCRIALDQISPPPDGVFHARSLFGASRNTYDLMTQTAEYELCDCRINPHQCLRTSSEIHAAGVRELLVFKGFRRRLNCLTPRPPVVETSGGHLRP